MTEHHNINILSGIDNDFANKVKNTLSFLAKANKLNYSVQVIDSVETMNMSDYLILFLDEISLEQLVTDKKTKSFLNQKEINKRQIIIISDELDYKKLPDYLHCFSHFKLFNEKDLIQENDVVDNDNNNFIQLIFDIVRYIKEDNSEKKEKQLTVFMGPPDGETTYESHKIVRELLHHNYNIVPDIINESAINLLDNTNHLEELLVKSDLAIHFISHESLEEYPNQVSPSIKVNEKVAAYCTANKTFDIERFIYVPAETEATSEEAIIKISQFKSNTDSLYKGELLQTPIEKLKSIILDKLSFLQKDNQSLNEPITDDDIYVIFPPGIDDSGIELIKILSASGIKHSLSQVNLDQLELLHYHQNKLTHCKAVVIINFGNEEWLQRKISDVQKSPGWGRKEPFAFKIICGEKPSDEMLDKLSKTSFQFKKEITMSELKKLAN